MKTLFILLVCLTLTTHAQTWPRNPKTGKVEFDGLLPWPATAKTEAQRRALVRKWYLAKLTDSTPQEVAEDTRTAVSPALLTYAQLPTITAIQQGAPMQGYSLSYTIGLAPDKQGISYKISGFTFSKRSESDSTPLEPHLIAPTETEQAALATLRKRLAKALASWD